MSTLTNTEKKRLKAVETTTTQIAHLVQGTASKNQLNRLLTLAQEEMRGLKGKLNDLEAQMTTLLALARKLQ